MLEPLVPRTDQAKVIDMILTDKSHMCAAQMGAGKTLIGVEAVLRSGAKVTLLVCPLNTLAGWRTTFERQSAGEAVFRQISSTKDGVQAHEACRAGEPGVYFIGTEFFRRFDWEQAPLDFVVVDEGHRFQNRKSSNWLMLNTTFRVEYKLYLSGTPAGNKIQGLWAGCKWLWPDYKAYWPWVSTWLKTELDQYAGKKIMGEKNPGALWDSLPSKSKFASSYTGEPSIHEIEVKLAPAQLKLYKKFEQEAVVWLDQHPLISELPATQALRLRQMTLGVPSIRYINVMKRDPDTGDEWEETVEEVYFEDDCKSSKIDALLDILTDIYAEKPVPVMVYTHSKKFATVVAKRLQAKGYNARQFVGGMSKAEREWKLSSFGIEYDILVATIPTLAEGVNGLQDRSNIEIWLSVSDNRMLNSQARARLSRPGQLKTVQRYLIRALDTVELAQVGRLASDDALLAESFDRAA